MSKKKMWVGKACVIYFISRRALLIVKIFNAVSRVAFKAAELSERAFVAVRAAVDVPVQGIRVLHQRAIDKKQKKQAVLQKAVLQNIKLTERKVISLSKENYAAVESKPTDATIERKVIYLTKPDDIRKDKSVL